MKSVIFLSPPAAGKGTFSDYLIKKYNYIHLSTGDILRNKAKTDQNLASLLASGSFVSDEIILDIVKDTLSSINNKPFILDGVPRTINQANLLNDIFNELNIHNIVAIYVNTNKDILINRVVGRIICPKCHLSYNSIIDEFKPKIDNICDVCGSELIHRDDDNLESYEKRYNEFMMKTEPIKKIYEDMNILHTINNNDSDITNSLNTLEGVISD